MSQLSRVKIDSRGRIVLPQHFREFLGLKENDSAYAVLDEKNRQHKIQAAAEKGLVYLEIELEDAPGSLARAAAALEKEGVDLVATESHSTLRGKKAVWRVTGHCAKSPAELKKRLENRGLAVAKSGRA
ncbi:MAG: hypothetical protein Q8P02_02365 [Candidatus Micrarchaeota archaeon]|nr:hypothetical protein [Candidatus Micrarchaeota archaeon]